MRYCRRPTLNGLKGAHTQMWQWRRLTPHRPGSYPTAGLCRGWRSVATSRTWSGMSPSRYPAFQLHFCPRPAELCEALLAFLRQVDT